MFGTAHLGGCMNNTVSLFHVQLRNIGLCVADLLVRHGLGWPLLVRTKEQQGVPRSNREQP